MFTQLTVNELAVFSGTSARTGLHYCIYASMHRLFPLDLNPTKTSIQLRLASAFNRLSQCANSPDSEDYCYTELAVSSLAVAVTITRGLYQNGPKP